MASDLAALSITRESHPKLYFFLRHHPEILQVFHNIEEDVELSSGIRLSQADSQDIVGVYIENLHIPLLLESKAIRKNPSRKCGFEALVGGLRFREYDSTYAAKVAADRAGALAKMAKVKDNNENSLFCYYHGAGEKIECSSELLSGIRKLILEYANNSDKDQTSSAQAGYKFDLVVSARISGNDEK